MKVIVNETPQEMSYEDVCWKLGMISEINFVKITSRGRIGFTIGKRSEVSALYDAIEKAGMKPSCGICQTLDRNFVS